MCLLQKKFKRLKRVIDDDSDEADEGDGRDRIANQIFQGSDVSTYIFLRDFISGRTNHSKSTSVI